MRHLSKTRLLAYRQCQKRLWLEIHRPELREDSNGTKASFRIGNEVGAIARQIFDAEGRGVLIDAQRDGFDQAIEQSTDLLTSVRPIFEAGFAAAGALALADVMLPVRRGGKKAWRMIEVKSSTEVKDYHRDDAAVQAFVAREAGVPLAAISLAHIDSSWVYPGGGDYQGLLVENDLTDDAFARGNEVKSWIAEAQKVARKKTAPDIRTGRHCNNPYECGFHGFCASQEPSAKFPVSWLPRVQSRALRTLLDKGGVVDLRKVPDDLLNDRQRRVKTCSLSGEVFFDAEGALADLSGHKLPAYFLDFETIQFAIPRWKGTRPYQQIPFQFSVHRLARTGRVAQEVFLDLTGNDPSRSFAESLITACGEKGPVFVYNAGFETARIKELAARFPRLKARLLAINDRVVDLLRVAEQRYYHPSQQGSWSIKKVLPAVVPELRYDQLDGVQDGGMAMERFLEAISPTTTSARKEEIRQQLLKYCGLDTYAMVKLWQFFSDRNDLDL